MAPSDPAAVKVLAEVKPPLSPKAPVVLKEMLVARSEPAMVLSRIIVEVTLPDPMAVTPVLEMVMSPDTAWLDQLVPLAIKMFLSVAVVVPRVAPLILAVVAVKTPVDPEAVTSPVMEMVWSPVLEPERVAPEAMLEETRAPAMVKAPALVILLAEEKNWMSPLVAFEVEMRVRVSPDAVPPVRVKLPVPAIDVPV